jgi:hypothetical protein
LTPRISPSTVFAACGAGTLTRLMVTPSPAPSVADACPGGDGAPTKRPVPSMMVGLAAGRSASSGVPVVARGRFWTAPGRVNGAGRHEFTTGASSIVCHADVVSATNEINSAQCIDEYRGGDRKLVISFR